MWYYIVVLVCSVCGGGVFGRACEGRCGGVCRAWEWETAVSSSHVRPRLLIDCVWLIAFD